MKVYFIELTHKKTGKILYKFGQTSSSDILERFKTTFHNNRLWAEFSIKPMWSAYCTKEQADNFEREMQGRYPKNIYLETYLNESGGYFDGLSGITEVTTFSQNTKNQILRELFNRKDSKQKLI